jgi:hypothetical protein
LAVLQTSADIMDTFLSSRSLSSLYAAGRSFANLSLQGGGMKPGRN